MNLRSRLFQFAHPERVEAYRAFDGPKPSFPLGNQGPFLRKPAWQVCEQIRESHGPLALVWIKSRPLLLVTDPRLAHAVLLQGRDAFVSEDPLRLLGLLHRADPSLEDAGLGHQEIFRAQEFPPSLVAGSGLDAWFEERMPALVADLEERAQAFAIESREEPQPLFPALLRITFNALTRISLGQELSQTAFDDFVELAMGKTRKSLGFGMLERREDLHGSPRERLLQAIGKHVSMAQRYPDEGRQDLIGKLLEGDYALSEAQWPASLLRIYLTTCWPLASHLTSTLRLLSHHPIALEALELELDRADPITALYPLLRLPVLDGVYQEGLRLAPALPLVGRRIKDTRKVELEGRQVPAGTGILIHLGPLQRDPEFWERPDRMDPARWQKEAGRLVDREEPLELAHASAFRSLPSAAISEWLGKLVLHTWLKQYTVLAGEGLALDHGDRYVNGLRVPASVLARAYERLQRPADAQPAQEESTETEKATKSRSLLPASVRIGLPKALHKAKSQRTPRP